jgi:hypothetical protein
VLSLPYKATEIAALAAIISAWMRPGIFEAALLKTGVDLSAFRADLRTW